jgi:hypothetical protein
MERREPDFEDDRLRYWRRPIGPERPFDADPTVLSVDLATEQIFESRIYAVRPEALIGLFASTLEPDEPVDISMLILAASEEAAFRMLAKQRRSDGLLTYVVVGQFGPSRRLLAREDLEEESYRDFVKRFERDSDQLVESPTVIDRTQWDAYEAEEGRHDTP